MQYVRITKVEVSTASSLTSDSVQKQTVPFLALNLMAGIKLAPEEPETTPQQQARATTDSLASDDDRSIAADSWSIKSEYGSTLDDDQRHADAAEALSSANFRVSSDYRYTFPLLPAALGNLGIRMRN